MTNQASEDKLTKAIYEAMQVPYLSERHDAIKKLISTEKTKLLDEVIHQSTVNLKSANAVAGWAELRKKQLEAGL